MINEFTKITYQKFSHIRERSAAKYSKDKKRLIRAAIPVEFTLEQFRTWCEQRFGADGWESMPCMYACSRYITLQTFVPDHITPLSRGGRNHFSNLGACCEYCNDEKGELSGVWYEFLKRCLDQMPAEEASIIRDRLRKSEKAAATVRRMRAQNKKQQTAAPIQQLQEQL